MKPGGGGKRYALANGVRSSLSFLLGPPGKAAGALNFYSREPGFFGEVQTRQAAALPRMRPPRWGSPRGLAGQAVLTDHLRASLASRSVIDQAVGVLMAEQRCDAGEAFRILRVASQNRNVKLRQVAEEVWPPYRAAPPAAALRSCAARKLDRVVDLPASPARLVQ